MTLEELKQYIQDNYSAYFSIIDEGNKRFSVAFHTELFPHIIYIAENVVINVYELGDWVTFYDLISLDGLEKDCLPFMETYRSRNLKLSKTPVFIMKMILDRIVDRLNELQVKAKEKALENKMDNINEDFK